MDFKQGLEILAQVVRELEARAIPYWVGRGLFRHFTLHEEFGDEQGDIDLHILREDERDLAPVVDALERAGYALVSTAGQTHKITLRRCGVEVEFVFLERDGTTLWHQAGWPRGYRYDCPADCFKERRIAICGVQVRVPEPEYLPEVFGPDWQLNMKGAGGRPLA